MQDRMFLQIVSSSGAAIEATVREIYIPAFNGEAGVLENHKPYISLLKPGEIHFVDIHNKKHYFYIRDGFLEVLNNQISIISDSVERGENLKREEIAAALVDLDKRIKSSLKGEISPEELETALSMQREFKLKMDIIEKIEAKK